jgi:hypothetical protein
MNQEESMLGGRNSAFPDNDFVKKLLPFLRKIERS